MFWRPLIVAGVLALGVPARAPRAEEAGLDLREWLADSALWSRPVDDLMKQAGLQWTAADQTLARSGRIPLRWFTLPVWEAQLRCQAGQPSALVVSLYNRGDAGDLDKEAFQKLVRDAGAQLAAWAGRPGTPLTDQLKTTGVRRDGLAWLRPPHRLRLLWSFSTKDAEGRFAYRSEFVRIEIQPAAAAPPAARGPAAPADLKARVRRETGGDTVIDSVPMVDQGDKGYCSVATAERVMRYYGLDVDQHELAQIAASSAAAGTNPDTMISALKRTGSKLGFRLRVLEDFDVHDFLKMIDRYNREARRRDLPEIQTGRLIEVAWIYQAMDYDALREIRTHPPGDRDRFLQQIAAWIDQGIPLQWSVTMGKVVEEPPVEGSGGHMRMIIGYNRTSGHVLYTDSWGPGHERKRMPLDDAWAITTGLYVIEPR